ncbi:MAG: methylenetetrahydrofolate reductase [NAD(P)H] [Candidatus Nanopelagicales bacterium]
MANDDLSGTRGADGSSVRVVDLITQSRPSVSFEFFPPKTDVGEQNFWSALDELALLKPDFVSVTYGAGGSTRDRTVAITKRIATQSDLIPVGHFTCVGATKDQVREVIGEFAQAGVSNLLALRGDPPGGPSTPWEPTPDGINFASELVELIKSEGDFCVGVAAAPEGHPGSESIDQDVQAMLAKQEAGAEFALTQLFFEARHYFDFVEKCQAAGVTIPIVPGIQPVTNLGQIERFAELSGAQFPQYMHDELIELDESGVAQRGAENATELCRELLAGGAPGVHIFTLNRTEPAATIVRNLGLDR